MDYDLVLQYIVATVSLGLTIFYILLFYLDISLPQKVIYLEFASLWGAIALVYLIQIKKVVKTHSKNEKP